MSSTPHEAPPAPEELSALLRLLDDETPEVRRRVAERLARCDGDLSEFLAAHSRRLSADELDVLSVLLRPAKREALLRDWQVPGGGAAALCEDWETFEALLRVISDFLHDGVSVRQSLSDALDLLAEDALQADVVTANDLRVFLFEERRLAGNAEERLDPRNSDLAWVVAEGRSNPLGLVVVFMLVARRLDLVVEAVNFPGHFLCRIHEDGCPLIIDCFDGGRMHLQAELLEDPQLGRAERMVLSGTAHPGVVMVRLLNNLVAALDGKGRTQDARLVRRLRASLS